MSVLIKGMEKPGNCGECQFCHTQLSETWCCIMGREDIFFDAVPDWCPLVEVKEPHGDLIDRNELKKSVLKWLPPDPCGVEESERPFETDICVSMMMEIEEQPAVIEAEGAEE